MQVIIASHLGRPKPESESYDTMRSKYSLAPVADALAQALPKGSFAGLAPDCVGDEVKAMVAKLQDGQASLTQG